MNSRKHKILVAALVVLLLSVLITGVILFLQIQRSSSPPATFADIREADIPGRYKMNEGATKEMFIVLYPDNTFMNEDGTTYPQYRWELLSNSVSITWQHNTTYFTNMVSPGIYFGSKGNGDPLRLEKLPPYTPEQLRPASPVAFIRFGVQCETNHLIPVHNGEGADGEIVPANIAGADCFQLVRKPGKTDAYLYLQIAPELKDPPFTNAFVVVEFFDRASTVGRPGRLLIQYDDDRIGAYASTQPLPLAGSETWQEATFYLSTPLLQGRQNGGADFRLVVSRSELPIRSVKLLKNVPIPETKMPVVGPR